LKAGILIISDKGWRGERRDKSGPILVRFLEEEIGAEVVGPEIIPDEEEIISSRLIDFVEKGCALVLTSGGTGVGPRDVTPEATRKVITREVPGIAEGMRIFSFSKTPFALISRGICGIRERTLIINLPGSPKAVSESIEILSKIIPHTLSVLKGEEGHPQC
jgi:molybdenum cofactor synthesis domain-containing protein